ncbi:MAG: hypothetical protein DRP13_02340 [Candidatus Aenigmatarchaeota archaeon]|nr:MAG: hypothetical protein DRP13_02340 [Candidatus Aenigmarchaeota archaeon]
MKNKIHFRAKARMVKILGEHLIRDNTVGLMELIKNGYDADATVVTVHILKIRNPEETTIIVEDNGEGMTEDIIRGPWFEPGHGGKEKAKHERRVTKKGRLPLGEKGVGRFAAQKLGKKLELITRPAGSKCEFYININWDDFEETDKYMDEIELDLVKRKPEVFKGTSHGTKLIIKDCRTPWKKKDLEKIQANLIRLLAPSKTVKDFKVILRCPEFPEIENLETSDIIEKFQFKIECYVDEKGYATYTYYQRSPNGKTNKKTEKINLWAMINPDSWTYTLPSCGPFKTTISAWLLRSETIREYGISKEQLKILGGVSIYRDGFRVLPYGNEGNDWLGLDPRRINAPGERYDNNQIIGIVEINQLDNPQLIDKTNREGLQENQAYFDLQDLVLGVISLLERESFEQREREKPHITKKKELEKRNKELEERLEKLSKEIKKIKETKITIPLEKKVEKKGETGKIVQIPAETITNIENETLQLKDEAAAIRKEARSLVDELSEMKEEKMEAFLHLLGIGLAAERFAHEFDSLVYLISNDINKISRGNCNEKIIHHLDMCVNALRNEVSLMGICRFVRRGQKSSEVSVIRTMEIVLKAYERELTEARIDTEIVKKGDFKVFISEASLAQVFSNIISNALYWLKLKSETDKRKIRVTINQKENSVIVVNSGPRILPNIKKYIFKRPFVTSKPDGRGLGMYITAEILRRNNAEIKILNDLDPENSLGGAGFKIIFYQNVKSDHSSV